VLLLRLSLGFVVIIIPSPFFASPIRIVSSLPWARLAGQKLVEERGEAKYVGWIAGLEDKCSRKCATRCVRLREFAPQLSEPAKNLT
jgi:hypothetical protein